MRGKINELKLKMFFGYIFRMRSAQLAQRAAHPPVVQDPYYPYYSPYAPYYQPALAAPAIEVRTMS